MVGKTRNVKYNYDADRRGWVEQLGLLPALDALGDHLCRKWYGGNLDTMKQRELMYSKLILTDAYNFWMDNYPEAFPKYKTLKGVDLYDHIIMDRVRFQWLRYERRPDGTVLKIDHERSNEHRSINKVYDKKAAD